MEVNVNCKALSGRDLRDAPLNSKILGKWCYNLLGAQKTTFGMPSPIPFMGRKKWFEKETYYSGTIFLEVFDKAKPLTPIVQLKKSVRNLERLPSIGHMAKWTQGAEQPFLVMVEQGNLLQKQKGRILLVRPGNGGSEIGSK